MAYRISVSKGNDGRITEFYLKGFKVTRFDSPSEVICRKRDNRFVRDESAGAATKTVTAQLFDLLRMNPGVGSNAFQKLAADRGLGRNRARQFLNDKVVEGHVRLDYGPQRSQRHFLIEGHDAP